MRIVEPSWPLIVKLGQGARLQDRSRLRADRDDAVGIARHHLGHPLAQIGRFQPRLPQVVQPPSRLRDGYRAGVVSILGGWDVGRQAIREGKRFKGRAWRISRIVPDPEPCAKPDRPGAMKATLEDSRRDVVITSDNDELVVRTNGRWHRHKEPMLCHCWRRNIARKWLQGGQHTGWRFNMPPPKTAISLAPVLVALRLDVREAMSE